MIAKIINSGSDGNCCVIQDADKNEIILDCGVLYTKIASVVNLSKLDFICVSHFHSDHVKGLDKFEKFGFNVYSPKNIQSNVLIDTPHWKIMPMEVIHNIKCFGFLIYNKIEQKNLVYLTDTTFIPNINLSNIDLLIIETNYDKDIINKCEQDKIQINVGYKNHLSLQEVVNYLNNKKIIVPNIVAYHLSNSGLIDIQKVKSILKKFARNVYMSAPNTIISF